jgi:hypothetical protein
MISQKNTHDGENSKFDVILMLMALLLVVIRFNIQAFLHNISEDSLDKAMKI